jgi:ABC-type nitrate/sulfonate/bicarbonate transport system permease component
MHNGDIDVRYGFVVSEAAAIPIAAIIAAARIAEAVVHSAVKAYSVTPVAAVPTVPSFIEIPVGRGP